MLASIWPSRDENHGLIGHNSEQRAPKMLASIWPRFPRFSRLPVAFREKNHGLIGHNSEQRAPMMLASIWPSRDENHGLIGHNSEQRAPMMLASIWPRFPRFTRLPVAFRDENHGQNGHNLALPLCRLLWTTLEARISFFPHICLLFLNKCVSLQR